jgi:hypothetical protein
MPRALVEASGFSPSALHSGVYYTINDSDKKLMLFAIRESGEIVATFRLTGVDLPEEYPFGVHGTGDMEAVSVAPCEQGGGGGSCIFLGDIGQNCARPRARCPWLRPQGLGSILRFQEPAQLPANAKGSQDLPGERFWFRYPGGNPGPFDAETLVVSPLGEIFVATKTDDRFSQIFEVPALAATPDSAVEGSLVTSVATNSSTTFGSNRSTSYFSMVSDGCIQTNGSTVTGFTLLSYGGLLHWPVTDGNLKAALSQEPCQADHPSDFFPRVPQAEGLAWLRANGTGATGFDLFVTGESPGGVRSPIMRTRCRAPQ